MSIESDIFKRCKLDKTKLEPYGFKKDNKTYTYEKNFLNNNFKAVISIDEKGTISGKVIDLQVNDEFLGLRTDAIGDFVNSVRDSYKDILNDIKKHCYKKEYFVYNQTNRITKYIIKKYHNEPEFLWEKLPTCGVFRNERNNKWYAIIMNIDISKIDSGTGEVEIMNVKLEREEIQKLIKKDGYYKAYHMGKADWITIILNDTLDDKEITNLIDKSYNIINSK